jgi:hypothetical protein
VSPLLDGLEQSWALLVGVDGFVEQGLGNTACEVGALANGSDDDSE